MLRNISVRTFIMYFLVTAFLLIDGLIVNGSARVVAVFAKIFRRAQTGYVNSAATYMVLGVLILLTFCTGLILH